MLEHVKDLFAVIRELHRVLVPAGLLHVMVPDAGHVNALADPTHVRFFNVQTFKYFCQPHRDLPGFWPDSVSTDGASILADLRACSSEEPCAPPEVLVRFFD